MFEIREFEGTARGEWRPATGSELALIGFSADLDEWEFFPLIGKETRDGSVFRLVLRDYYNEDGVAYDEGVEIRRLPPI